MAWQGIANDMPRSVMIQITGGSKNIQKPQGKGLLLVTAKMVID